MILCIGTTPALQRVMVFKQFALNAVNRAIETLDGTGGKAINVAKVLAQLGGGPVALGFAGGQRGRLLRAELQRSGIRSDLLEVEPETRLCTTIVDRGAGTISELVEESAAVSPADYERLLALVVRDIPAAKAIVMSGTLAPGGSPDFYARCVTAARSQGVLSVVDAQGPPLLASLVERPSVVKPNRNELSKTLGSPLKDEQDVWRGIDALISQGACAVVVTDGPAGVFAGTANQRWKITPPAVQAVNPIGSGDSFTAAMALELVRGKDLGEACRAGAAAGAANALALLPGVVDHVAYERLLSQTRSAPL